ncbi:cytochrome P450 [Mesorhizobium sp.]|uniref:cytochrome P450 n=1 Tax=Mesorhizobium sp. TaxID=1871066 RepID=UPI000FE9B9FB|nr:cytochrome P450 [Mesorhizobium sp.]RWH78071.1 MAG: cytochrome P450 [Mesorhizobium sp.]
MAKHEIPNFPFACPHALDLPPEFAAMREDGGIGRIKLWDGQVAWLVTGFEEARIVLGHPGTSADSVKPGYPHISAARRVSDQGDRSFIRLDDPAHSRIRRMLTKHFTVARAESLRPVIRGIADTVITTMLTGPQPAELKSQFATPLITRTLCHFFGAPFEDESFFNEHQERRLKLSASPEDVEASTRALIEYVDGLVSAKLTSPGDDLISALIEDQLRPGHITRDELTLTLRIVLGAGHETTASTILMGTLALLMHQDQAEALRQNTNLMPAAVEEILRFVGTFRNSTPNRVALDDIEVGEVTIRAGEGIIVSPAAVNRDGRKFGRPDEFDISRGDRSHLAFGFGIHQCLGQNIARVELEEGLSALLGRVPGLRLAVDPAEITLKDHLLATPETLPVCWG